VAREQTTRPSVVPPIHGTLDPLTPRAKGGLTPAEEHALRRSEPLAPARFKELRRLAEQGISPLRHL
jgi:predicted nuclease with RNAse H fold